MAGMVPGYPDPEISIEAYKALIDAGADIIEFSSSFSDPIADGPTLQKAHVKVLKNRTGKAEILKIYKTLREYNKETPFFLIEYANVIYQKGIEEYYHQIKSAGIDALKIPDLSMEEAEPYVKAAKKNDIHQVFGIAPTTPDERIKKISDYSSGFLYLVTITGITGEREKFEQETTEFITRVKKHTTLPCVAGFGISKPEHVETLVKAGADGVVSCSKIVNIVTEHKDSIEKMQNELKKYVKLMNHE